MVEKATTPNEVRKQRNFASVVIHRYIGTKNNNFISVIYRGTKKIGYAVLFFHHWKGLGGSCRPFSYQSYIEEQISSFIGSCCVIKREFWEKRFGL